jgi:hypothetical protein
MNRSRLFTLLVLSTTISMAMAPVRSEGTSSTQSSTTQTTTEIGSPTIIQHIDSKMEPVAVQSSNQTNPTTGETKTVVQPIIMERHDKVLDTTIIQPQVTETKTFTENAVRAKQTSVPSHKVLAESHASLHRPHRIVAKRIARAHTHTYKSNESSSTSVVETVTRQAAIKETTIKASPAENSPPAPQIIQKTE